MKKTNVLRLLSFAAVCTLMVGCTAPAGGGATTTQNSTVTTTTTQTETTALGGDSTTTTEEPVKTTATPQEPKTPVDLMKNIKAGVVTGKETDDVFAKASTQLALDLFKAAIAEDEDENVLVSPLSVQMALAMTANGAAGKTLEEMETVLGGIKIADLNRYLYTYNKGLPTEETCSVKSVNGIWFRNGLNVKQPFLKTNAEYYGAAAYESAFDAQTVKDINSWVSKQTDGLIDSLVDEIDNDDMMYLVNALLFEASWASKFSEKETRLGTFVTEDGKERKVAMLYNRYETCRLGDDKAEGFAKGYKGGKYSFVAMLPNEGISVDEYIQSLTVDGVRTMLQTPTTRETFALLFPKFDVEYEFEMEDTLQALGMKTAFDGGANFSGIANGALWLDEVLQKTAISVSETGTKAAAATQVRVTKGMAKSKIEFTRPFVYMIVDNEADMPLFIGTVKDLKEISASEAAKLEK